MFGHFNFFTAIKFYLRCYCKKIKFFQEYKLFYKFFRWIILDGWKLFFSLLFRNQYYLCFVDKTLGYLFVIKFFFF